VAIPARLSFVTLGVADLERATRFYQALVWPLSSGSVPGEVSFFRTAGGLLALRVPGTWPPTSVLEPNPRRDFEPPRWR